MRGEEVRSTYPHMWCPITMWNRIICSSMPDAVKWCGMFLGCVNLSTAMPPRHSGDRLPGTCYRTSDGLHRLPHGVRSTRFGGGET